MTTYHYKYCTRSLIGASTCLVAAILLGIALFVIQVPNGRMFGIFFGLFALFGFTTSAYQLISPDTWSIDVTDRLIRWTSSRWPRESREVSLSDIIEARSDDGEIVKFLLTLHSGESVRIPANCVGDSRALLAALKKNRPAIQLFYMDQKVVGFVPSRWAGYRTIREG